MGKTLILKQPLRDPYIKINQCLGEIRNLMSKLRNIRNPSLLSLAIPLNPLLLPLTMLVASYPIYLNIGLG